MKLGIHLPQFREPVTGDDLSAFARDAEHAGADDLWVSDHLIIPTGSERPPEMFHDPFTVLTWAAAATSRVGVGTSVIVAPYRHPVGLAKTVASLDALSGGRVILGIASGWMEEEFRALGVPFAQRGRRTDQTIDICRALWRGQDATDLSEGTLEGMVLSPPPMTPGGPPVWIGGNSDAGIARAVRVGDGWHTTISDEDGLRERVGALESALHDAGRPRGEFTLSVRVRANLERLRRVAPRLRDLGVDHVLVDDPDEQRPIGDRVVEMREIVSR